MSERKRSIMKSSASYLDERLRKKALGKDPGKQKTSILQQRKLPPQMYEDMDVTPTSLNPYIYAPGRERQISMCESLSKDADFLMQPQSLTRDESQRFQTNLLLQKQEMDSATFTRKSIVTSAYFGDDIVIAPIGMSYKSDTSPLITLLSGSGVVVDIHEPSIPEHISLILQETENIVLLDLPSALVSKTSDEAADVEEDNKNYEYLTTGKGRNRKVLSVEVQTLPILRKSRDTETKRVRHKNNTSYVSGWEMFDTYKDIVIIASDDEDDELASINEEDDGLMDHMLNEEGSVESYRLPQEEKALLKILKSKAFQDALTVIERILGNNCYNEEQKRYKGLSDPDPFRENIEYKYKLQLLWTFTNDDTDGKCVTDIAFNSENEDIIAVAYGKYFYNDRNCTGMIMIWNIKNPRQPERQYKFQFPVTTLAFSKAIPNLLAAGFYNGQFKILDISKREVTEIREDSTCFEPVWGILWFVQGDDEDLMVSYGDGRVFRYQITSSEKLKRTQIMITAAAEGQLKGINYLRKCEGKDISITGYDQGRCLAMHPADAFTYFVGTSEGVIHRCSTNYYNEHMDLLKAHDGAIHAIKFSPFADKLYLTCGDDFRARLWADGIPEPLLSTPLSSVPALDLDWSPQNPTIIASIRGVDILIWDFQRKMYQPQSVEKSPTGSFNTVCRFTKNGRCLLVGDIGGNIHVFSLEDVPIPPFFPENLISQSLRGLLLTKPVLLKKLRKLGPLNFDKAQFSKYFN